MKNLSLFLSAASIAFNAMAQDLPVETQITVDGCYLMTSESSFTVMPEESGVFKNNESTKVTNKFNRHESQVIREPYAMTLELSMGSKAHTLKLLSGYEGKDIVIEGETSSLVIPFGDDIRITYRTDDNIADPKEMVRVVKLIQSDNCRRVRWHKEDLKFIRYNVARNGDCDYLITIPGRSLEKGEYAIVTGQSTKSEKIPVEMEITSPRISIATFSVQ